MKETPSDVSLIALLTTRPSKSSTEERGKTLRRKTDEQQNEISDRCVCACTVLTGDGTKVQVVSDHLLELVVQGAFLELQAEVMAQVRVQHFTCGDTINST